MSSPPAASTSTPSKRTAPAVGSTRRIMQRAGGRLAAAGLAHQPEGLAGPQLEADAVDRAHGADLPVPGAAADREVLDQVLDHQQGGGAHAAGDPGALGRHLGRRQDARGEMAGAHRAQRRHGLGALRTAGAAARVERAARGRVDEGGRVARVSAPASGRARVEPGDRVQQAPGVGVLRGGEDGLGRPLLDDPPGVHHRDAVGHPGHDAEVVGDQQDPRPQRALLLLHQVQDLGLDGHVERRGGLVGDEQGGAAGEGHGDHHPLAHAARELVRVVVEASLGVRHAHLAQQLTPPARGPPHGRGPGAAAAAP